MGKMEKQPPQKWTFQKLRDILPTVIEFLEMKVQSFQRAYIYVPKSFSKF
jgi:hypothetical protein